MAEQFYTILTNTGKAKIANALPTGAKVNLTKLKVGDSNGAYYNPSESQTDLVHTVYTCSVTSVEADKNNPSWITITAAIPSDVGGFSIREVGVFDDKNSLIAIGKYPETYKPVASDGSTKELYIKMTLEVTNASSVDLKIDPTVIIATKKDINNLQEKIKENTAQLSDIVLDIKELGAIGDGNSHPLSEKFTTLASAQAIYPCATALTDEIDWCAIQTAMNDTVRYKILVPEGIYIVNKTIIHKRGKIFVGKGGLDTGKCAVIKLANNSNCKIYETVTGTHFMGIQNIKFDGNAQNQTVSNTGVIFGGYITSFIKYIVVYNVRGSGLETYGDLKVEHVWCIGNFALNGEYAWSINKDMDTSKFKGGLHNYDHIYIENNLNKIDGSVTNESDRADGILIKGVVSFNVNELHIEGCRVPIVLDDNFLININVFHTANCGNSSYSENTAILLKNPTKIITVGHSEHYKHNLSYLIKKITGFSHLNYKDIVIKSWSNSIRFCDFGVDNPTMSGLDVNNMLNVTKIDGYSYPGYKITLPRGNISIVGDDKFFKIITTIDGITKECLVSNPVTPSGDISLTLGGATYLGSKTDAGYLGYGAVFLMNNVPVMSKGSNATVSIATINKQSGSPTINSDYIGQIYVDTTNKIGYLAVNTGTGALDWKQITN